MINEKLLADLLMRALESRNARNKVKVEVKAKVVCRDFVKSYLDAVFREVVNNPAEFGFGELGSLKTIEHVSHKGYEWDQKYDAKDWSVIWRHKFTHAKIVIDEKVNRRAVINGSKGMEYGRK